MIIYIVAFIIIVMIMIASICLFKTSIDSELEDKEVFREDDLQDDKEKKG